MAKKRSKSVPHGKTPDRALGHGTPVLNPTPAGAAFEQRTFRQGSVIWNEGSYLAGRELQAAAIERAAALTSRPGQIPLTVPGVTAADQAVAFSLKPGETLFDLIQAELATGMVDGIWRIEGYERLRAAHAARMQQRLRRAHRYVLDDSATELTSKFGVNQFDLLGQAMPSIRPPFESMWIEFSPAAKVAAIGQTPNMDTPPRSALLIERVSAEYQVYSVCSSGIAESEKSGRMPTFGVYEALLDFGDEPYLTGIEMRGFETAILDRLSDEDLSGMLNTARDVREGFRPFMMAMILCGPAIQLENGQVTNRTNIDRFCNRACLRWQREMVPGIGRIDDEETGKVFSKVMRATLVDDVGMARFAAAVLALLTHRTAVAETEAVERHGTRLRHGRNLPYYGYSTIRVKLPREIVLSKMAKTIRNDITAMRRRRHDVEAHWCHSGKLRHGCGRWNHNGAPDPHDWEPVVADQRYRCRRCGCKRWSRKGHERGDASLGWVRQKRVVVARSEQTGAAA